MKTTEEFHSLASTNAATPAYAPVAAGALHAKRILVVDDEPDARKLVSLVFSLQGAETREAGSAAEAFAEIQGWQPDFLISDIGMPGEDGVALIRKVRSLSPDEGGQTPAVALTAYASLQDKTRVLDAGFHMHLAKPVEPMDLVAAILELGRMTGRI